MAETNEITKAREAVQSARDARLKTLQHAHDSPGNPAATEADNVAYAGISEAEMELSKLLDAPVIPRE